MQDTNLRKYGNVCSLNGKEQIEKKKQTWLNNFGKTNPYQKDDIKEKAKKNRLSKYLYDDKKFDSKFELAFYIYHKDKGHRIEREPKYFEYISKGKIRRYYPDFLLGNKYIELKGEHLIIKDKRNEIIGFVNPFNGHKDFDKLKCMMDNKVKLIIDTDPRSKNMLNIYNLPMEKII